MDANRDKKDAEKTNVDAGIDDRSHKKIPRSDREDRGLERADEASLMNEAYDYSEEDMEEEDRRRRSA